MRAITAVVPIVLACVLSTSGAARAGGSLDGRFEAGQISVEIRSAGDRFSGTLTIKGAGYPLSGAVANGRMTGVYAFDGRDIPIEATLEGDTLVLVSGRTTHRLARAGGAGGANPLDDPNLASSAPGPLVLPDDAGALMHKYAQVVPLEGSTCIRCPADWTLNDGGQFKTLLPSNQLLPLSVYQVASIPWAGGLPDGSAQAFDRILPLLGQFLPPLEKDGPVENLGRTVADGFRMKFNGPELAGIATRFDVFARIQGGQLILLIGAGESVTLDSHANTAKEMMRTIGAGAPPSHSAGLIGGRRDSRGPTSGPLGPLDPTLFGAWRSIDPDEPDVVSTIVLNADGTWTQTDTESDPDEDSGPTSEVVDGGQWTASNGAATFASRDGSVERFQYRLDGSRLSCVFADGTVITCTR